MATLHTAITTLSRLHALKPNELEPTQLWTWVLSHDALTDVLQLFCAIGLWFLLRLGTHNNYGVNKQKHMKCHHFWCRSCSVVVAVFKINFFLFKNQQLRSNYGPQNIANYNRILLLERSCVEKIGTQTDGDSRAQKGGTERRHTHVATWKWQAHQVPRGLSQEFFCKAPQALR